MSAFLELMVAPATAEAVSSNHAEGSWLPTCLRSGVGFFVIGVLKRTKGEDRIVWVSHLCDAEGWFIRSSVPSSRLSEYESLDSTQHVSFALFK